MDWKYRLQPASFRGIAFKVSEDEATYGRRVKTYEYPLRDVPFTDDFGRSARKYQITAYVIGSDYMDKRDALLTALEKGGAATLVHPFYGTLNVNVDGPFRLKHSRDNGGMCEISLNFVEAGSYLYPATAADTAGELANAANIADDSLAQIFADNFDLEGAADWVTDNVIDNVSGMLDSVIDVFATVDSYVADAARLLQGDLSVLFPPPSQITEIVNRVEAMWRVAQKTYFDADSAISSIDNLKYTVSLARLAPQGAWPTLSETQTEVVNNSNAMAQLLRGTALSQSTRQLAALPSPPTQAPGASIRSTSHASVESYNPENIPAALPVSYDQLAAERSSYTELFDQETARAVGDNGYQGLETLRIATSKDLRHRLIQAGKMTTRTPVEVIPAIVLAADWYDDAARANEIVARNNIPHPGFVPPAPLRVSIE